LSLKAKAHLLGLGALVHGGRALAISPGVGVAACARAAAVAAFLRRRRHNLRPNLVIFGDFGGGYTHGGAGPLCARTVRRSRPLEGARAPPTRTSIPTP
jgi:hypothetical protein